MWDLSSLTRAGTWAPALGVGSPDRWTARKVPWRVNSYSSTFDTNCIIGHPAFHPWPLPIGHWVLQTFWVGLQVLPCSFHSCMVFSASLVGFSDSWFLGTIVQSYNICWCPNMQAYLLDTFLEFLGPSGQISLPIFFFNIYLAALNLSSSMKDL